MKHPGGNEISAATAASSHSGFLCGEHLPPISFKHVVAGEAPSTQLLPDLVGKSMSALSCQGGGQRAGLWGPPVRRGVSQGPGHLRMSPQVTLVHVS